MKIEVCIATVSTIGRQETNITIIEEFDLEDNQLWSLSLKGIDCNLTWGQVEQDANPNGKFSDGRENQKTTTILDQALKARGYGIESWFIVKRNTLGVVVKRLPKEK